MPDRKPATEDGQNEDVGGPASAFFIGHSAFLTVVVWDGGLDGERLAALPGYKAQRPELPPELGAQIEGMQEFLEAAGVASVQVEGVEADDVIAGLAELAAGVGWDVLIASSDKDFMQLVSEERQNDEGRMQKAECSMRSEGSPSSFPVVGRIGLVNPGDKSERVWGAAEVWAKAGVRPSQVVDWLALVGDAVDNIPGVRGVGTKTAAALLGRFGSVEGIFGRLAEVESVRLRQALAAAEGVVRRNVGLVRLKRLVPPGVSLEGLRGRSPREITAAGGANAGVRAISRGEPGEITAAGGANAGVRVISRGEPDWGRLAGLFRRWGFRGLLAVAEARCAGLAGAAVERSNLRSRLERPGSANGSSPREIKTGVADNVSVGAISRGKASAPPAPDRNCATEDGQAVLL